jgi:hypothetical protein
VANDELRSLADAVEAADIRCILSIGHRKRKPTGHCFMARLALVLERNREGSIVGNLVLSQQKAREVPIDLGYVTKINSLLLA